MKKLFLTTVIFIFAALLLVTCASSGSNSGGTASGSASSGSRGTRLAFRDIPAVTKAAFDKLDPVFQRNLKPNAAIAVFPISTDSNDDSEAMYAELQINIVNSNRYTIVEKRHVDGLLAEHDFQRSGIVSADTAVSFGRLLNADAVIVGAVTGKGSDRELALIGVDMAKRTTLAVANEPWPQAYEGGSRGRAAAGKTFPQSMGLGNVLLLPVIGGTDGDNITLRNFLVKLKDIQDACNLIDETMNTSILPANFTGTANEDNDFLFNLGLKYKANFIIYTNIQKFGQRNLAIISKYNVLRKQTDSVYYQEYLDPIEAWIKLPGVISTIMKGGKTDNVKTRHIWVRYKDGVDRVLADRALSLLTTDFAEATGGVLWDRSVEFETAIAIRQGDPLKGRVGPRKDNFNPPRTQIPNLNWSTFIAPYFDGVKNEGLTDAMAALHFDLGVTGDPLVMGDCMFINVSRQGNKTRFQLLGITSLDFTDIRDFVRQMRGLTLSIASGKATVGYDLGIVQGVKYNYWKYAGEDSTIPDIVTYTQKFPKPQDVRANASGFKSAQFKTPDNILLYIAKENNFSKAAFADVRKVYGGNVGSNWEIFNLEPNTIYYVWPVSCWGYLLWLQSDPGAPITVKTRELRDEWSDQVMWDR